MKIGFDYDSGKIKRVFTAEQLNNKIINVNKIPSLVQMLVDNNMEMAQYIELLHNKIDDLIQKNNMCYTPECHMANCTSDHK